MKPNPFFCAMGDSITYGIGMPAGTPCWVEQLKSRFSFSGCVNLSRGGESSRDALAKLEILKTLKPDIVTVQYGMNDHYLMPGGTNNVPEDEFRENLKKILSACGNAAVILLTNHRIIEGDESHYYFHRHPKELYRIPPNAWLERYNAIIRETAAAGGYPLADLWEESLKFDPETFLSSRKNTPLPEGDDGVHPHILGSRIYLETISNILSAIL